MRKDEQRLCKQLKTTEMREKSGVMISVCATVALACDIAGDSTIYGQHHIEFYVLL